LDPADLTDRADLDLADRVSLLYEDEHLLAADKPAGVVVHPTYKNPAGTLIDALRDHARGWAAGCRPSLVGRLDKLTSGVVIVAKTAGVHAALQRGVAWEKDYLALVYGGVNPERGEIDLRLRVDEFDRRRVIASATVGKPCVTRFERITAIDGLSLLRCRPLTGRRHQIRVHLASNGWPIVGDPGYPAQGPEAQPWLRIEDSGLRRRLRAFPRQALHAWRVAFDHPVTGVRVAIESPIPADLRDLLASAFDLETLGL
jgi:23S rRNA pseudouridine1911/1915/1917 synthase